MIKVSVMYPNTPGARFNHEYYRDKHMPMVAAKMGKSLLRYTVDQTQRDLRPGEHMRTPRGSVHAFSNPHERTARALIVLTPDIGAQYFRDVADVVNAGGPPDRSRLLAVMSRYGLVPAPPQTDSC